MRGYDVRHDWARSEALAIVAATFLCAAASSAGIAAEKDLTDKGEVLVRENCSRCHAVGLEGASPNPQAPPFRTLSSKYPIENLAESLAEGIVSGHPEMPVFAFGPHDVDAIIAYMESIQRAEPPDPVETPQSVPGSTPGE